MHDISRPTTRGCLQLLGGLPGRGQLTVLGCADDLLAVEAVQLGFAPVKAVDVRPEAALAALVAAVRAGVRVDCLLADLLVMPAPFAPVVCADVPAHVHAAIATRMPDWPDHLVASGFDPDLLEAIADGYARLGLAPRRTIEVEGWISCLFQR